MDLNVRPSCLSLPHEEHTQLQHQASSLATVPLPSHWILEKVWQTLGTDEMLADYIWVLLILSPNSGGTFFPLQLRESTGIRYSQLKLQKAPFSSLSKQKANYKINADFQGWRMPYKTLEKMGLERQLRALVALAKDSGLIPSTYTVARTYP